jgi:hypothetical protein
MYLHYIGYFTIIFVTFLLPKPSLILPITTNAHTLDQCIFPCLNSFQTLSAYFLFTPPLDTRLQKYFPVFFIKYGLQKGCARTMDYARIELPEW